MSLILHLTTKEAWVTGVRAGQYEHPSLRSEGFIHASTAEQAIETANIYYRGSNDLAVVCIDTERLTSELRWEESRARGQAFPHIYGPLNLDAVTQALEMRPVEDDGFEALPDGIDFETYSNSIWLRAVNHDGTRHWDHPALLHSIQPGLVMTRTGYGTIVAREKGIYVSPFHTRAHYWEDRWFNVIRLSGRDHRLDGYYCNIAAPLPFDGTAVRYADMQLDVRVFVGPDGALSWRLLDEDEFQAACKKYAYSREIIDRCYAAVDELVAMVKARAFPFDA